MKIAIIIVRVLMGLIFLFASIVYFFDLVTPPELQGDIRLFNEGIAAAKYIMPLVKTLELFCALAFLSGRFIAKATLVIFPIIINILLFHIFLAPEGLLMAVFLFLSNIFIAYAYRQHYKLLFIPKKINA